MSEIDQFRAAADRTLQQKVRAILAHHQRHRAPLARLLTLTRV